MRDQCKNQKDGREKNLHFHSFNLFNTHIHLLLTGSKAGKASWKQGNDVGID